MRIGILQCDDVLESLQPEFGNYPQMLENLLAGVDPACEFRVYRVVDGELPATLEACDAYITTGSRYGVNDGFEWIARLEEFVRRLYRAGKPLVGICFGHQLIARALGGRVALSDRGWGVGVSFNRVAQRKPWMEPFQADLDLVVSHQDQVTLLPEGAEVLAESDFCPYYMVQINRHFLSVQGHPEFSRPYSAALMETRRNRIPANRIREGINSLNADVDDRLMTRWIVNFFKAALVERRRGESDRQESHLEQIGA